jgi:hypothetical protein
MLVCVTTIHKKRGKNVINLDHNGKRRGTDFGRALARLVLATAIAMSAAAFAAGDGSIAAAARHAFSQDANS